MRKFVLAYCVTVTLISIGLLIKMYELQKKNAQNSESLQQLSTLVSYNYNDLIGKQFINFSLEEVSGKIWTLSRVDSVLKIIVVFNINDCAKCLQDYRIYNAISDKYSQKIVAMLSISNNQLEEINSYIIQKKLRYPVLCDTTSIVKNFMGIRTSPLLFILNKENRILDLMVPGQGHSYQLFDKIHKILVDSKGGATSHE